MSDLQYEFLLLLCESMLEGMSARHVRDGSWDLLCLRFIDVFLQFLLIINAMHDVRARVLLANRQCDADLDMSEMSRELQVLHGSFEHAVRSLRYWIMQQLHGRLILRRHELLRTVLNEILLADVLDRLLDSYLHALPSELRDLQ